MWPRKWVIQRMERITFEHVSIADITTVILVTQDCTITEEISIAYNSIRKFMLQVAAEKSTYS